MNFIKRLSSVAKLLVVVILASVSSPSLGHDIDVTGVARVFLDEVGTGQYQLSVVDQQVPPIFDLANILPSRCQTLEPSRFSYRFNCSPSLNINDVISFPWSFEAVVIVAKWQDGDSVSGYFPGDGNFIDIRLAELKAGSGSLTKLAGRYLVLGGEHILFGLDHLLFVFALLLLVSGFIKLLQTITAFTLAHSLSLACAVLGIIPVPNAPIEVLIALSIILLAREIIMAQRGRVSLAQRKPWLIAFVFGLIHGFGFAGALGEIGLRDADIPLALLFFNLGVEAGQVAFITCLVVINILIGKVLSQLLPRLHTILAYSLGIVATYWFIERLPALQLS